MIKLVNGHFVEFRVVLQESTATFPKVINICLASNGGRQGVATDIFEALEYARDIANLETNWASQQYEHSKDYIKEA